MDLIIFNDGLYYLYPVTPELVAGEVWKDCFDLCDILRDKLTVYNSDIRCRCLIYMYVWVKTKIFYYIVIIDK